MSQSSTVRASGLRVTLPDELRLADEAAPAPPVRTTRGARRLPTGPVALPPEVGAPLVAAGGGPGSGSGIGAGPAEADLTRAMAEALGGDDLVTVDVVGVQPVPAGDRRRRGPGEAAEPARLEVDLAAGEGAVVLLEQGGVYSWHFAGGTAAPAAAAAATRSGPRTGPRTAVFELPLTASSVATAGPTAAAGRTRGFVTDLLLAPAKAILFRFAARVVAGKATAYLEKSVEPGLRIMDGDDPLAWRRVETMADVPLRRAGSPRILLFVHGTFSSTAGGFGGLAATPWGRDFLAAARANYDAVVGFDHPSLSVDPEVNATDLLRRLRAREWEGTPRFDIICHSRGGITTRSLLERLVPESGWGAEFERVVFAAAVNNGTLLAQPENWHALLDLYTNLAAGACRAAGLFPGVTFATGLLAELVKGLGGFAKALATEVVDRGAMPGLAAMEPDGPFIRRLNETQPGQPLPAAARWFALTSDFKPDLTPASFPEIPKALLFSLANGLIDRLMGEANDLVVNTASMTTIDPAVGGFIKDTLAFGVNGVVFHTNYFLQPQTTNALARWLELDRVDVVARRSSRGVARAPVPARFDTDFLVTSAADGAREVADWITSVSPTYVVVERRHAGQFYRYAMAAEEVLEAAGRAPDAPLENALGLHEFTASQEGSASGPPVPDPASPFPSARRGIILDGDRVIGVADPRHDGARPVAELVELAGRVLHPHGPADDVARRRALPTLGGAAGSGAPRRSMRPAPAAAAPAELPAMAPSPGPIPERSPTRGPTRGPGAGAVPPPPPSPPPPPPPPSLGGPAAGGAPGGGAVAEIATCHFRAEMDEVLPVGDDATVDVTVSREVLAAAVRGQAIGGAASVAINETLTLELIPRRNVEAIGKRRFDFPPPAPGHPVPRVFDIRPTTVGEGEVWVRARQDGVPLITLELKFQIVAGPVARSVRAIQPATVPASIAGTAAPRHQLTIFERFDGGRWSYQFILDSPTLGWKHVFDSAPIVGDRKAYIDARYKEIEDRWVNSQEDVAVFHEELRALGGQMWEELFPADLQALLWKARAALDAILVFSEEPFVPWELVHFKEPGRPLGPDSLFLAEVGLVRWLHRRDAQGQAGYPPVELHARPGRCRYVIPEYPDPRYVLPETDDERDFLVREFAATPIDPQPIPVRQALQGPGAFDLFHFAGHGEADTGNIAAARLLLQGRVDQQRQWTPASISETTVGQASNLATEDGVRPIVVLNACQVGRAGYHLTQIGGFAQAFLKGGAGMFVGSSWEVGDAPASTFTRTLYLRLKAGDTLAAATREARQEARRAGDATWLAYTVYGHPEARLARA